MTVFYILQRFLTFFRFNKYDKHRCKADLDKDKFYDVWKSAMPEGAFKYDKVRCQRVADLIKFNLLTY